MLPNAQAFRIFFENSPQAMWVFDISDGRFLAVNKAGCQRYGYSEDEFLKMTIFDIRPPGDVPRVQDSLSFLRSGGQIDKPHQWEHRTKNGEQIFVEVLSTIIDMEGVRASFAVLRDVTAEHTLRTEQQRFFELSQDMMVIRTLDGTIKMVNPAATKILGWSAEELSGFHPDELIHPDDLRVRHENLDRAISAGGSRTWEARVRTKDGGYRWMQFAGSADLELKCLFAVARDITESRAVLERLRESESDLAWAQQASHLGSWRFDVTQQEFSLSDEYYRITGYPPGGYEPTWDNILKCIHPEDRYLVEMGREDRAAVAWPRQFELRMQYVSGEIRHVLSYVDMVFDDLGELSAVHGTIQDITERKRGEEVRTWLAEIVSSSTDAILGKSLDGKIVSWNAAAERMYGYSADEMIGQNIEVLIPPHRKAELNFIFDRLMRGERIAEFETERMDRFGRIFEARLNISPILAADGTIIGAASVCRDISARKEADRRLARRLAQLTALRQVDLSILGAPDIALSLETVVVQALVASDVESVCVLVLDKTTGEPASVASGCRSGGPVPQHVVDAASLYARSAARNPELPISCHESFEAWPLTVRGSVIGVLTIHHGDEVQPSAEQSGFFETLSGQAAIAVESATMFGELQSSHEALEAAYDETLEGWARALDLRDRETEGHSRRVTDLTELMAQRLGLSDVELVQIRRGALLHDIGKLGIPDAILLKPGPLIDEEWEVMRKHPTYGRDILAPIGFLAGALDIPYCHHEKWDGSGYPRGLRGEEIPLSARIFAFADIWDALVSDRPYRSAWPVERVREYMLEQSGRHFDPAILPVFLELVNDR